MKLNWRISRLVWDGGTHYAYHPASSQVKFRVEKIPHSGIDTWHWERLRDISEAWELPWTETCSEASGWVNSWQAARKAAEHTLTQSWQIERGSEVLT